MKRREFIAGLGGAAAAWPFAARAQQSDRVRLIGVLMGFASKDPEAQSSFVAFQKALEGLGLIEGRNVRIEARWMGDDPERGKAYVAELAAMVPDVIFCAPERSIVELSRLTRAIPIVFARVVDPVDIGIVQSLAKPGGNITGFSSFEPTMGGKWLQILKEMVPSVSRVDVLIQPENSGNAVLWRAVERAASGLSIKMEAASVHDADEIERAFATLSSQANCGLIVLANPITQGNRDLIISLAASHRLPAVYPYRFFSAAGGLVSYGPDTIDQYRRAASYVDRILKGEKPADLPVQQPAKFEFVINLKTAKTLGITIPQTLQASADEVIE